MSLAEICSCDYDSDWRGFQVEKIRNARKRHRCCECAGFVEPGEKYERAVGCYEGSMWESVTCIRCLDIRRWIRNQIPCFCWLYGEMLDKAKQTVVAAYEVAPDEVRGLFMGLSRRLIALDQHNGRRNSAFRGGWIQ
jgi:hypothetical protein